MILRPLIGLLFHILCAGRVSFMSNSKLLLIYQYIENLLPDTFSYNPLADLFKISDEKRCFGAMTGRDWVRIWHRSLL